MACCCQGGVFEEQEDAAAAASIIFVTTYLFQTMLAGLCVVNAHPSWFACSPSSGTRRCSSRSCMDQNYPLIITLWCFKVKMALVWLNFFPIQKSNKPKSCNDLQSNALFLLLDFLQSKYFNKKHEGIWSVCCFIEEKNKSEWLFLSANSMCTTEQTVNWNYNSEEQLLQEICLCPTVLASKADAIMAGASGQQNWWWAQLGELLCHQEGTESLQLFSHHLLDFRSLGFLRFLCCSVLIFLENVVFDVRLWRRLLNLSDGVKITGV